MRFDFPASFQVPALRELWKEAFADSDSFLDDFFSTGFDPQRCRCALDDGTLAAALYWFDCEFQGRRLAYLYAVATAQAFRRRGICHALMEDTHVLLQARGYSGALLVPGSAALGVFYQGLDYRYATRIREFRCAAGQSPVALRPVDASEYALLRRELLPDGGVLQEGAALPFLATQAQLYAGAHLLLAARREGDALFGLELLGDTAAAPGILRALGASQGQFRTPGEGRVFAMYRPFDDTPVPDYLAFAFD